MRWLSVLMVVLTISGVSLYAQDVKKPVDPFELKAPVVITQAKTIELAWADCTALRAVSYDTTNVRYVSCYFLQNGAARRRAYQTLTFVVNSLSRRAQVTTPTVVGGSDGTLFRIDLDHYSIPPSAWEKLIENGSGPENARMPEPYFHEALATPVKKPAGGASRREFRPHQRCWQRTSAKIEVICDEDAVVTINGDRTTASGIRRTFETPELRSNELVYDVVVVNGSEKLTAKVFVKPGWETIVDSTEVVDTKVSDGKTRDVKAINVYEKLKHASWLPEVKIVELSAMTSSIGPVVRVDWFIYYSTIAPAYYDFLGLGNKRQDFLNLIRTDLAKADVSEVRGAAVFSTVALHNRGLRRFLAMSGMLHGYYWESLDYFKSFDEADIASNLLTDTADARELIGTLPNGLQAYFLVNAKDERQDVVPAAIAQDNETSLQDKQIYAGRNCMMCHANGIRAINDRVRRLSQKQIALLVPVLDKKGIQNAKKVADKYFSIDITTATKNDEILFTAAVKSCNGLGGEVNGGQLQGHLKTYFDNAVTLDVAAAEVGLTKAEVLVILKRGTNLDQSLVGLLQEPEEPARRDQWERRGFPQLMLIINSVGGEEK